MKTEFERTLMRSLNRNIWVGLVTTGLFLGGFGGWAWTASLSGAVIASGFLVVEGKAKKVQQPDGGVLSQVFVKEGEAVKAGQIVARLDDTVLKATLKAVQENLIQLHARRARLQAELDGSEAVETPIEIIDRLPVSNRAAAMAPEQRLFADRRAERESRKAQLDGQIEQLKAQIEGFSLVATAKQEELALTASDREVQADLLDKALTYKSTISRLDHIAAQLRGELGSTRAEIASVRGRIEELGLQRLQVDQAMRAESAAELRDLQAKQTELLMQEVNAQEALSRTDIRSPVAGTVHRLEIHTVGGVITPAEVLMEIVPKAGDLLIEARINPADIDQLHLGEPSRLRFSSFNRNTTPELTGELARISADLETDERTGAPFYRASIRLADGEAEKLEGLSLLPGMPAEVFIETGSRNAASWLIKPIMDHAIHVFREE